MQTVSVIIVAAALAALVYTLRWRQSEVEKIEPDCFKAYWFPTLTLVLIVWIGWSGIILAMT